MFSSTTHNSCLTLTTSLPLLKLVVQETGANTADTAEHHQCEDDSDPDICQEPLVFVLPEAGPCFRYNCDIIQLSHKYSEVVLRWIHSNCHCSAITYIPSGKQIILNSVLCKMLPLFALLFYHQHLHN